MSDKINKRKISSIIKHNASGWALLIPSLILFVMIVWRPILIGITYSTFRLQGFTPVEFVGLKNFSDVLTDTNFIQTLKNTVAYVFWSLVIGFPLPFICAVMLNELVHMQGYFKVTTYLPVIIPSIATCLIWRLVYMDGEGGLLNMMLYYLGISPMGWLSNKNMVIPLIIVAMSWNTFGSTLIMYFASLQGINQELYEAARLDGAGFFNRIRFVLLPHMKGMLLLMLIRQIIGVFNVTEQPLTMTGGGPNNASMSLGLTNYFYAFKYGQYDKSLALGVITFLMLLVLTFIYFGLDKRIEE
ncbi:MAG: sugar ABC transporter permease [Clostridia bacterium]|nr:sugar ABC transporter permease [Clostridia bacterium]